MSNLSELVVPELGESITEAVVGRWLKKVGEAIEVDEPVVDLETDKITVQLPASASGALVAQKYAEGDTVHVGDVVGHIEVGAKGEAAQAEAEGEAETGAEAEGEAEKKAEKKAKAAAKAKPAPAAKPQPPAPQAESRKLSPSQRRAKRRGEPIPVPEGVSLPAPVVDSGAADARPREDVQKMTPLRKRIAERLVQAQHSTASLTTFNEVDMTNCVAARSRFKQEFFDTHGVKLGFMSFFVKAAVASLKDFPGVNAEVRDDAIVYKNYYDVGIAVGTDRGLVVPVLRGADKLGFADIEKGINDLATRARDSKLKLDDLVGATFTISNGGVYGSMMSTPLLNYPQTGILGMHNIVKRPMAVGDGVEVRPVMYIALTYDHRVVDGFEAVSFLKGIKERVENPDRLLFGV